ncbi:HAAS signaling domain-containing protein [Microbacterium sp. NPDC087665]|uniref:HAAS signaling domain-containing protein n=1 Tax=Microbacterium sp. NPDC087665 TaxID=3364194 RepID=UPI0037FD0087
MTESFSADPREEYLARLDDAMRDLPHGVAADIRSGIAEEFHGLGPDGVAARIAQLGDPAEIARRAREELPSGAYPAAAPSLPAPVAPRPSSTTTRGFAIAAALTLSIGGFVVPVVGWFVGAVLVSLSPLWKTGEKVIAIVVPFVLAVTTGILVSGMGFLAFETGGESSGGSGGSGPAEAVNNPLVPTGYDMFWSGLMVLGVVLIPLSGLWLLWRMRGRTAR